MMIKNQKSSLKKLKETMTMTQQKQVTMTKKKFRQILMKASMKTQMTLSIWMPKMTTKMSHKMKKLKKM